MQKLYLVNPLNRNEQLHTLKTREHALIYFAYKNKHIKRKKYKTGEEN